VNPNPVAHGDRVLFTLGPGVSTVTVLDAAGRTVISRDVSAGRTSWDLRGPDGGLVTPGTYFVRASGRGPADTRPFVVVR